MGVKEPKMGHVYMAGFVVVWPQVVTCKHVF